MAGMGKALMDIMDIDTAAAKTAVERGMRKQEGAKATSAGTAARKQLDRIMSKHDDGKMLNADDIEKFMLNYNKAKDLIKKKDISMTMKEFNSKYMSPSALRKANDDMAEAKMSGALKGGKSKDLMDVEGFNRGGMKKPKKMNMGGQMQNRFSKQDYRKGGLFR